MRKLSSLLAVGLVCVAACPMAFGSITSHHADPVVGDKVKFNYIVDEGVGGNHGGPFVGTLYQPNGTTVKNLWKTFCVEAGNGSVEYFTPGTKYNVLSTALHIATATGNYVTDAAKWLYYQSLHNPGALVGYVPENIGSDTLLQEAIWHGVRKNGQWGAPLNTPYEGLALTWYRAALAATSAGQWAHADSVRVLNPGSDEQHQSQSMLYEAPEPATIIIWSLLLAGSCLGMRVWRRRG